MVDPILYRPHERQESQKLLTAMLDGRDFFPAVQSLSDDFHPRFFHELDWQELRPDRDYSHGPGVFQVIDDYAFAATLPSNALVRMRPGSDARSRFGKWLESYQAFFGEWVALWPAPDAYMARTPELIEHAVEALSCVGCPAGPLIQVDALAVVERALTAHNSRARVLSAVRTSLANALFVYLDHPVTRLQAKRFLRDDRRRGGGLPVLWTMTDEEVRSAEGVVDYLHAIADTGRAHGLVPWSISVDGVADLVHGSDLDDRKDFGGSWTDAPLPCGRCSMWFAGECITALDSRSPFVNWRNTNLTYLPAELNLATCIFCGHSAPIEAPAFFYSPQRAQVVYSVPTRLPAIEEEAAPDFYRVVIGVLRKEYRAHLSAEAAARFDSASELLTYSLPEFLQAMQTGETLVEDHLTISCSSLTEPVCCSISPKDCSRRQHRRDGFPASGRRGRRPQRGRRADGHPCRRGRRPQGGWHVAAHLCRRFHESDCPEDWA